MDRRKGVVFDLFCGTGGFSKGFEDQGGFRVAFGIDLLEKSVATFRENHPQAAGVQRDIREFRPSQAEELTGCGRGDVAVVVGGPPCQGFSSIRPFRSSSDEDPRNGLFEQFASFVNYFRPPVFVFENVVGLATHRQGKTLAAVQECFSSLGYDTDWCILNAAHFGVPQKRERLILIGAEAGLSVEFPAPTHSGSFKTIGYGDNRRLLRPGVGPFADALPPALTVNDAIGDLPPVPSGGVVESYGRHRAKNAYQRARRKGRKQLALHSATRHTAKMLEIIRHAGPNIDCIPKHLITSGFSSCYSRLDADEPAVTITVNFIHPASNRCIHPTQDRALTLREGARLQGFDDDFVFVGNRSQIAKQIGNAVPPLLGRVLAGPIAEALGLARKKAARARRPVPT